MTALLHLSVVTACLDEQEVLCSFVERCSNACAQVVGESYEIVLVNDGSRDGTLAVMKALAENNPHLVVVNLTRCFGHQAALSAGLSETSGARVLTIDADLQDPPELLGKMMRALDAGSDIAFGKRTARAGERFFKRWSAMCFYRLFSKLSDAPMPDQAGDFRLMSRRVVTVLCAMPEGGRFLRGMTGWTGFSQTPVPYERARRQAGKTKYPLTKMLCFAADAITGFSVKPLRIASYTGALFGFAGLALLFYVLRAWLSGETVEGWTSMMVVLLLIGGMQLLCLGIFGEYLGRLFMESKKRPLFIIESVTRGKGGSPSRGDPSIDTP